MGFFKNASNFTIGSSTNNEVASGANVTYTIHNGQLLPPSAQAALVAAHIPVQVNRASSAPQAIPPPAPALAPQLATAHSGPAAPIADNVTAATESVGPLPVKSNPPAGQPLPETPSPRSLSIPSPPPSPKLNTRAKSHDPSRNSAQAPSSPVHQRPSRPRPKPVQPDLTESAPVGTLDADSDATPQYRYGIVAAVKAQAHLLHSSKAIGDLLGAHGINNASWVAQSGFRLNSSEDDPDVGLPAVLRQEIVITISHSRASRRKLSQLMQGLKEHISPYYGRLKFSDSGKTLDLESHTKEEAEHSSSRDIFTPACSRSYESAFDGDCFDAREAGEAGFVKLAVVNSESNEDPQPSPNHFKTSATFELDRGGKSRQGSNASGIKCSELRLEGPSSYALQGASVRFGLDQACGFKDVVPDEVFEIDPTAQLKHTAQKTKKEETKTTAQLDVAQIPKFIAKMSKTTGFDDMNGVEEMRNAWQVWHSTGLASQTIRYASSLPAFGRRMTFAETLRPGMKFLINKKRPLPTTITVRIVSFWTLEPQATKNPGGLLGRLLPSRFGSKSQYGVEGGTRAYCNVAHCVELVIPMAFMGSVDKTVVQNDVLERLTM